MSTSENIGIIQEVYGAFGRGDVEFIVSRLTDDVTWISHFDAVVPWGGDFSGKERVPSFFTAIFESVDVEAFEPTEWVAEGDSVVSVGEFICRVRATGKSARARWVFLWKLRDGKIYSYEQFHGPEMAEAFRS